MSSCTRAPCVGPDHPAYDALHWDDPAEASAGSRIWKTNSKAIGAAGQPCGCSGGRPNGDTDTAEEATARAIRQRLGWEHPSGLARGKDDPRRSATAGPRA